MSTATEASRITRKAMNGTPPVDWVARHEAVFWQLVMLALGYAVVLFCATAWWVRAVASKESDRGTRLTRVGLVTAFLGLWTLGLLSPLGLLLSTLSLLVSGRREGSPGIVIGLVGIVFLIAHVALARRVARVGVLAEDSGRYRNSELGDLTTFHPRAAFLRREPHRAIQIEIDWFPNSRPGEEAVARLVDFLGRHCDKPDGIDVDWSTAIPSGATSAGEGDALGARGPQGEAARLVDGEAAHDRGAQGEELDARHVLVLLRELHPGLVDEVGRVEADRVAGEGWTEEFGESSGRRELLQWLEGWKPDRFDLALVKRGFDA